MPGIADLMYALSGQPDPSRQLAAMLSGQQPPGAAPPGATPQPPGQTPSDGAGAQNNVAPGAQPPPGVQIPTALQSTPDLTQSYAQLANPPNLMSLMVQMQQRASASDQINRGLALMAASRSTPGMARAIMDSVGGGTDAGGMVNNLMSLYGAQQQMAAQQDMLRHAPDYDAKLNLPPGTARDMILAGRGSDLVSKMEPTDQQRNIQAQHDAYIKGGGSEDEWQKNYLPLIITGGIPGASPDTRQRVQALTKWQNDPANAGKPTPPYMLDDQKWKLFNTDLSDAKAQFNGMNDSLGRFIDQMGEVSNSPELDNVAGKPWSLEAAKAALKGTDAAQLTDKMKGLAGTAKDMASRGGPKGLSQNLKTLGSNPDDFANLGYSDYRGDVIAPRMRQALTAQANAYGAAGRLNEMPGYLQSYLDPMYKPGGDFDPGGGFKTVTPSKDLKQPDAAALNDFRTAMEHRGPKWALQKLEDAGYDTSSLR
jgi:hypothetical protein